MNKITHFLYTPFTGLGNYGGYRGKRWLRNRIKIFKQFVIPSLLAQANQNFICWISWRYEDKGDKDIIGLQNYIEDKGLRTVFTYSGVCFYDDKYPDNIARKRLVEAIHGSMGELLNSMGEADTVLMTIQPSDDCYHYMMVDRVQRFFSLNPKYQAYGYKTGYVMDYVNKKLCQWNPETMPPFYTIKFDRETFTEPFKHVQYTGPYKSHEYVKDYLKSRYNDDDRSFLVGTHGENISTIFNHPYTGHEYLGDNVERILDKFGLKRVELLKIKISLRKIIMRKLPHGWQRKLRYLLGEKFFARIYNWIRS